MPLTLKFLIVLSNLRNPFMLKQKMKNKLWNANSLSSIPYFYIGWWKVYLFRYTRLTYPVIFRGTGLVFHLLLGTFHKSCLTCTCPVNLRFWKLLHHHRSLNIEQQIREQNESKCRKRFFTTLIEGNFRFSGLQIVSEMKFILR